MWRWFNEHWAWKWWKWGKRGQQLWIHCTGGCGISKLWEKREADVGFPVNSFKPPKLFLIETPLTMWLWEFCICQLSTSNKSFVGLFKVAFKGSAIIVVRDNCWLEARGVAWGEVPSKESSSLCTTQAQLRAHYLILDTSPFAVQLSIGGPCKSSEVQQRK